MEQVCEAISYLHDSVSPRIAHKDLKCNNLLVRHHSFGAYNLGQVGEDLNLRVCDFGDGEEMKSSYLQCCTAGKTHAVSECLSASNLVIHPA